VLSWNFVVRLFNRVLAQAAFADIVSRDAASKANVKLLMQSGSMGLMTGAFYAPALKHPEICEPSADPFSAFTLLN